MAVSPASRHDTRRTFSKMQEGDEEIDGVSDQVSTDGSAEEFDTQNEMSQEKHDTQDAARQQISNVSFGALKQAQEALSRKRKRELDNSEDQEAKLASLRQRLQRLKKEKNTKNASAERSQQSRRRVDHISQGYAATREGDSNIHDDDDSDEDSSEGDSGAHRSKHAPATQSSKRQVTRKRQVIDVPKRITRDPRFDAVRQSHTQSTSDGREKAYGFLRDYQKSEMQELKSAIKATKSDQDKETLRRKLNAMENQAKAREAKERERDVVRKHRREESEQVRQGKTPYFLKRGEVKQRALVEKFQGMKSKDREKLLERRRRKDSQKDKKRMPELRRVP